MGLPGCSQMALETIRNQQVDPLAGHVLRLQSWRGDSRGLGKSRFRTPARATNLCGTSVAPSHGPSAPLLQRLIGTLSELVTKFGQLVACGLSRGIVEAIDRALVSTRKEVTIAIDGRANGSVTELSAHVVEAFAARQEDRCIRMPKAVGRELFG